MKGILTAPPIQVLSKSGSTISLSGTDLPTYQISDNNTTYSIATTNSNGLLSASDKSIIDKLNSIKPYFLVYYSGSGDTTFTGTVKFNNKVRDTHNSYSTSTGKYTVPIAGIYLFTFNYFTNDNTDPGSKRPCIRISGGDNSATVQMSSNRPGSISCIAYMPANATAEVAAYSSTWSMDFYAGSLHNSFSGTLISYI